MEIPRTGPTCGRRVTRGFPLMEGVLAGPSRLPQLADASLRPKCSGFHGHLVTQAVVVTLSFVRGDAENDVRADTSLRVDIVSEGLRDVVLALDARLVVHETHGAVDHDHHVEGVQVVGLNQLSHGVDELDALFRRRVESNLGEFLAKDVKLFEVDVEARTDQDICCGHVGYSLIVERERALVRFSSEVNWRLL